MNAGKQRPDWPVLKTVGDFGLCEIPIDHETFSFLRPHGSHLRASQKNAECNVTITEFFVQITPPSAGVLGIFRNSEFAAFRIRDSAPLLPLPQL
jgi:hypothetical protein